MIWKNMYKVLANKVIYEPMAGLTIRESIKEAIAISKIENKIVKIHINDIIINVSPNSVVEKLAMLYFNKLDQIDRLKTQRREKQR